MRMKIAYGYCHCGCGQQTAIAKKTQASQGDIAGKPRKYVRFHQPKPGRKRLSDEQFIEALWSKVNMSPGQGPKGECWCFTGSTDDDGYGIMRRTDFPPQRVHRVVLAAKLGRELEPQEQSLHRCDNPPCVRPDHLFSGTTGDNTADCIAKRRFHHSISDETVALLRKMYAPGRVSTYALSQIFRIAPSHVWRIVNGTRRVSNLDPEGMRE
jgi:hypothetical protein